MTTRATQAQLLEQRIAENTSSEAIDLVDWIFARIRMKATDQVLELCCGTGSQTLRLLASSGEGGRVVALDISREALDTLAKKVGTKSRNLMLVQAKLDELSEALTKSGFGPPSFDLIFCAYGLYYSNNPERTLEQARSWLHSGGRMVVIGPYGPNNKLLFDMLRASGVALPDPVIFSSEQFMLETVVPWGALNFESVNINTLVNHVRWSTPERVLNYWQNSTFYAAERRPAFEVLLNQHFAVHSKFINEKWVMMVEMANARS
jgi:ubiquinone/menaquinone biosynthesis C-methylase UbiE